MAETVDVLVVGAGPAGSRAATEAASAGASVLLAERKRRVGALPHCAEFVPQALGLETSISTRARVQAVKGMETRLGQEAVFTPGPGWILDRQVFDFELATEAVKAGAEIWVGASFQGWRREAAIIRRAGQEFEVKAGAVVAADGAASPIARSLELPAPRLLAGLQYQVPLAAESDRTLIFLASEIIGGYAWLFPKGRVANLGLGCEPTARPRQLLEGIRREMLGHGLTGKGVLAQSSGAIPVTGPRPQLTRGRVIFCGDAAGLTHPLTGAGIPQALFSGQEAGKAAARLASGDHSAGDHFQEQVLGRYGGYLERGLAARRQWDAGWREQGFADLMHSTWPAWRKPSQRRQDLGA
ncbi:MAG: geranylgeranyl reductase family protein [Desulfarculaceae bacterium]